MRRVFASMIDSALLLAMLAMLASSLLMAGDVFAFAPFPMPWQARGLHTCAAAWLFVLASLHAGLHWHGLWRVGSAFLGKYWRLVATGLCLGCLCCFIQSGIWSNMFLLDAGRPETLAQFLGQYLASALLCYLGPNLTLLGGKRF